MTFVVQQICGFQRSRESLLAGVENRSDLLRTLDNSGPTIVVERFEEGNDVRRAEEANERVAEVATAVVVSGQVEVVEIGNALLAHQLDEVIRV